MPFICTGNIVQHYVIEGAAQGPVLVFSNSLGTDLSTWDAVVPHFSKRFTILRYDSRGHGLTDVPSESCTMDDLVSDLVALLEALKIPDAVICGLSVGGLIAQGLAAAYPERVRALVLCDTAMKIGPRSLWDERIAAIEAGGMVALADAIMERWFTASFRKNRAAEIQGYKNMLVRTPVEGYVGICRAIRDADLTEAAGTIDKRTLVLCGEQDIATPPALGRALAGAIAGAEFALIADSGHLPCIEQPDALAHRIEQFFKEKRID